MIGNNVISYRLACHKMLVNDPFKHIRSAVPIPDTVGVDNGDRTLLADLQTICFRPVDAASAGKAQLLQPKF